jgi:hypothetical protein
MEGHHLDQFDATFYVSKRGRPPTFSGEKKKRKWVPESEIQTCARRRLAVFLRKRARDRRPRVPFLLLTRTTQELKCPVDFSKSGPPPDRRPRVPFLLLTRTTQELKCPVDFSKSGPFPDRRPRVSFFLQTRTTQELKCPVEFSKSGPSQDRRPRVHFFLQKLALLSVLVIFLTFIEKIQITVCLGVSLRSDRLAKALLH